MAIVGSLLLSRELGVRSDYGFRNRPKVCDLHVKFYLALLIFLVPNASTFFVG